MEKSGLVVEMESPDCLLAPKGIQALAGTSSADSASLKPPRTRRGKVTSLFQESGLVREPHRPGPVLAMEQDAIGPTAVRPRKVQEPAAREPEDILLCRLFFAIPFKRPGYGIGIVAVWVRENGDLLQGAAHIQKQACFVEVRCQRSAVAREQGSPVSNRVPVNRNGDALRSRGQLRDASRR